MVIAFKMVHCITGSDILCKSKEVQKMYNKKKKVGIVLIVMLVYVFMSVSFCYAEKVRVIEGVLQDVIHGSIKVKGNYYDISGVPLLDASGKEAAKDLLKPGKKVEIFFKDDRITKVVIHGYLVD